MMYRYRLLLLIILNKFIFASIDIPNRHIYFSIYKISIYQHVRYSYIIVALYTHMCPNIDRKINIVTAD